MSYLDAPLLFSPKMPITDLVDNLRTLEDEGIDLNLARAEFQSSPLYTELLTDSSANFTALQLILNPSIEYDRAINKRYATTFFGPYLSRSNPAGICIKEKPKKYPPAKRPRFPAVKSNSLERTGVRVAVIDLNKLDIKKPNAKTQKIKILLFALLIIYIFQT